MTELHQPQPMRAMDTIVASAEVPREQVLDFVEACAVLEVLIEKESPDILLLPQRGAGPIGWTVEALLEQKQLSGPRSVELPIGTYRLNTQRRYTQASGITFGEKRALISESLQNLHEEKTYVPGVSRLMLVDEVQTGSTLSKAATAVRTAMDSMDDGRLLSIVAFQDSRRELVGGRNAVRTSVFESLTSNRRPGFRTNTILAELFTVDRPTLLDEIVRDPGTSSERLGDQFQIIPNRGAREFFRALAYTYSQPDLALEEIDSLKRGNVLADIGSKALQECVLEYATDPRPVRARGHRTVDVAELLNWWEHFATLAKASRELRRER